MFSGTTQTGEYGEWQDLHAPFAPFCPQSLMTTDHARELFACAGAEPCNSQVLNYWKSMPAQTLTIASRYYATASQR
jgi:hypothetical protein